MTTPLPQTAWVMRVGDTTPPLALTLSDDDGPISLVGAVSIVVNCYGPGDALLWSGAAVIDGDPTLGGVSYQWQPTDVATPGEYALTIVVRWSDAVKTFPTEGSLPLIVEPGAPRTSFVLVLDPEDVLRDAGWSGSTPPQDLLDRAARRVRSSMVKVAAYLRRPIIPTQFTEPAPHYGRDLAHDPVIRIISQDQQPDGSSTVTYLAGYDCVNDPDKEPILEFIRADAVETLRNDTPSLRRVSSMSSNGQSIAYAMPGAQAWRLNAAGPAGTLPDIKMLRQWRKRGVFSRPRASAYGWGGGSPWGGPGTYVYTPGGSDYGWGDDTSPDPGWGPGWGF